MVSTRRAQFRRLSLLLTSLAFALARVALQRGRAFETVPRALPRPLAMASLPRARALTRYSPRASTRDHTT